MLLRYAACLNGFTSLAITKVDVLGGMESVPVCVQYLLPDGTTVRNGLPLDAGDLAKVQPVYEHLEGWPPFHERLKERLRREGANALPAPVRRFLEFLTQETGVPVEYVGYGPARDETVWLGPPMALGRPRSLTPWSG